MSGTGTMRSINNFLMSGTGTIKSMDNFLTKNHLFITRDARGGFEQSSLHAKRCSPAG